MLYLTYLAKDQNDGFGAQYQRILGIYCICKEHNIQYLHTGISDIGYQGLQALEKNKNDDSFTRECNKRINISEGQDTEIKLEEEICLKTLNHTELLQMIEYSKTKNVLIKLQIPYGITDINPALYRHCCGLYRTNLKSNNKVTIGVHVRRGELFVVDSDRMLPNSYYIDNVFRLIEICKKLHLYYEVELFTELPANDFVVTGNHPGIFNRIHNNVIIKREQHSIEDFDQIPNLNKYINEELLVTFDRMINCDILIASRSSLSACASYIKQGKTVYHSFWHKMKPEDIEYRDPKFNDIIEAYLKEKYINMKSQNV